MVDVGVSGGRASPCTWCGLVIVLAIVFVVMLVTLRP